ncbi:phospholipase D-like domain-containing anti-phage protein [Aminobacter sp. MET-1]|uniref:phospholipase D-like domain-containing anti-phage protein n=1 Tax=Aminobacter sp. MET-1 TaxID=2951085 RepID=UPI00226A02A8|nr:phospholipase D-like domain-containing anti-phage protein [Aminobacter sp. MET-1]MCX8571142.1 phospholipase D-like domain-containing protein [Aminobacter sp. MET-1]MCX8573189.1 phospholipase D-like domain-containing protein [Aminobacter sp. MET-1]
MEENPFRSSCTQFADGGGLSRFSSRHGRLSRTYLADRLRGARTYDRIAGYFRSSIFEIVGEEIEAIEKVRIVANADLDAEDVEAAQKVRDAKLFQRFTDDDIVVDATVHRGRYAKLYELLSAGKVEIRVVPRTVAPFLHGKAGVVRGDSGAVAFIGSINETRAAWEHNYELVWEDSSPEGVEWVQAEFDELWAQGKPLPEAIIREVGRLAERREVEIVEFATNPALVAPAALVESPIYRDGESLQPWQRAFVSQFLAHRDTYEKVRALLADEVGVGKTLSLAVSALISVLLGDGPVLILVPSTLTEQWQIELLDRLGMPVARWHSTKKCWIDPAGRTIKGAGASDVARCPYAIGIVSTGLIVHGMDRHGSPKAGSEAEHLLRRKFGMVILDEAHKARGSEPIGSTARTPNNLLTFIERIATRTRHLLLSTATPIQTSEKDLWDLLEALNQGAEFVLGTSFSHWRRPDVVLPYLKGDRQVADLREGWQLLTNPMPPIADDDLIADIRDALEMKPGEWATTKFASDISNPVVTAKADMELTGLREGLGYFQRDNPLLRHVVLRKRRDLEKLGLLPSLPVEIHPNRDVPPPGHLFRELSLFTSDAFDTAYQAVNAFTKAYAKRDKPAGFMKTLLLQRLCSSQAAGIATALALMGEGELDDDVQEEMEGEAFDALADERRHLRTMIEALQGSDDPKLRAVQYFLDEYRSASRSWREMGSIIFSQYYDTSAWIAESLSRAYPEQVIALYAGSGKSRLLVDGNATSIGRAQIKKLVANRDIKLVVATDAASEGLNLQTLGTLINVDLPWNPSRLEQRIGRIKRFGQTRTRVDMANLSYAGTIDEKVYRVLSERMKVSSDILGTLPETIDADWIEDIETLEKRLRDYTVPRKRFDPFESKYAAGLSKDDQRWDEASAVFARSDIERILSTGWPTKRG